MKKVGKHSSLQDKPKRPQLRHLAVGVVAVAPLLALTMPQAHALIPTTEPGVVKAEASVVEEYEVQDALHIPDTAGETDEDTSVVAGTAGDYGLVSAEKAPEPEPEPEPEPVEETVEEAVETPAESAEASDMDSGGSGESESHDVASDPAQGNTASASAPRGGDSSESNESSGESHGDARDAIIAEAKKHLGVPYVWGGNSPSQGFDCSGYTVWVFKHAVGINLPRNSGAQLTNGTKISQSEAKPGDIIHMPGHVGIYAGGGKMYHAPSSGDVVKLADIWTSSYSVVRYLD